MASPPPFYMIPAVEQRNDTTRFHIQPDSAKPKPAPSNRGRKPSSKGPPPRKKLRQRGLGVAQLEQIINNRNTSEINQPNPFNHVQVGVPLVVNNSTGGVFGGFDHQGFENRNPSLGPFQLNPYVFGAPDHMRVRVGSNNPSVFETSNELSSMPKIIQHYDHPPCDSCCNKKKKFVNGDHCIGYYNGRKEKFSEMSPTISGSDFQRLNLENNFEFNDNQRGGFGAGAAFFANTNNLTAGGAEVVAIHRKIDPKGPNVFMEYEFFPADKNNTSKKKDTFFKKMVGFQNPADGGGSKAPSCLTTCDYSAATTSPSNSVDLSLKLSF